MEANCRGLIRNARTGWVTLGCRRPAGTGYCIVKVRNKPVRVHRLVADAFLGPSHLMVNHRNGIKYDNRIENLEYVTNAQNVKHAYDTGLNANVAAQASARLRRLHLEKRVDYAKGRDHYAAKLNEELVRRIRASGGSRAKIAREMGISEWVVRDVRSRRTWKHIQ